VAVNIRVTANADDIDETLAGLGGRDTTAAVVVAMNRVLPSVRDLWADLILARYRSRSLKKRDVIDAIGIIRANFSTPEGRIFIRETGLSLARFIPTGRLRTQEKYRQRGGWKRPAAKVERTPTGRIKKRRPNERTPRLSVQVLADSVERTLKGAYVLESGKGFIILRPGADGKHQKLYATSLYSQARKVIESAKLEAHARERMSIELERDTNRRLERLARREGRQRDITRG